jgi:ribosomal protein S18 acetylase RimI-like enzyme
MSAAGIIAVTAPGPQLEAVRGLFSEYAESLGFSLCFQGFDEELHTLPGAYAPSRGTLLLAMADGNPAGCAGVRPFGAGRCEMKRLYTRAQHRGSGMGRRLAEAALAFARNAGYRQMLLDTLPQMAVAQALYRSLGFRDCPAYYDNTPLGSRCMALDLVSAGKPR